MDKLLLRKRALIESINDELKNMCQIEHTRHRSPTNFLVNLFSDLVAYTFFPKNHPLDILKFINLAFYLNRYVELTLNYVFSTQNYLL